MFRQLTLTNFDTVKITSLEPDVSFMEGYTVIRLEEGKKIE